MKKTSSPEGKDVFLIEVCELHIVVAVEGCFGGLAGGLDSGVLFGIMDGDLGELTETGTGRDEVTTDDILFHALEVIDLAADSGFVEHLGGLLEGGSGHEGLGTECGACDTLEYLLGGSALCITCFHQFLIAATEG